MVKGMWYHTAVYVLIDSTNAGMMEHSFTIKVME